MTTETPRPIIIDLKRVMMFADTPGVEGKRSKLVWSVRDGHPRISVFTNDPKDTTNKGIISAPMNPETFYTFLDLIESSVKADGEIIYKIECLTAKRDAEGKVNYNDKVHVSDAYAGKDANGMVWISLVVPNTNRPKIKFNFKISDYHKIYKGGVPLTESEASCVQATATVNIVRAAFYPLVSTNSVVNGNNGNTNTNESATVNSKPSVATFTEDIPF